jgi:hypothetical protein
MQPIMPGLINAWDSDTTGAFRKQTGVPSYLQAEGTEDPRVMEGLMQYAMAQHPDLMLEVEERAFDHAYRVDRRFRDRINSDIENEISKARAAGTWHSGKEKEFRENQDDFIRAWGLQRDYVTGQPIAEGAAPAPAPAVEAPPLETLPPKPLTKSTYEEHKTEGGPGYRFLTKDKKETAHPASQETNAPPAKVKKEVAVVSQPTDSKEKKKAAEISPRLQVKKPGGFGGLEAPPASEIPTRREKPWGKVEIDRSRLRHAVAVPESVKSLEDFIRDAGKGLGEFIERHKAAEKKYRSRFDTSPR